MTHCVAQFFILASLHASVVEIRYASRVVTLITVNRHVIFRSVIFHRGSSSTEQF